MIDWSLVAYFEPSEFGCPCGCGINNPSKELVYRLNSARVKAGVPFHLNSACRCEKHNAEVGGLPNSAHLTSETKVGYASDIAYHSSEMLFEIVDGLITSGFKRILIYKTFVHADVDPSKPYPVLKRM